MLLETDGNESFKRVCVESDSYDSESIGDESDANEPSLIDIVRLFSSRTSTNRDVSWDYFHDLIPKRPEQVTPLLFHQILMIPYPLVTLEVITALLAANPYLITGEAVKFLASMPWIPLDHVHHIISLERYHIEIMVDSDSEDDDDSRSSNGVIESVASKWLKVFDTLQHKDAPPPRLDVTELILDWLIPVLLEHDDVETIFSRFQLSKSSCHSNHIMYLIQVLRIFMECFEEIEDIEIQRTCHESFQRVVCDSVIISIISEWSDEDAEYGLRSIFATVRMSQYGITRITNSTALKVSFIKSKFKSSKFLIQSCPYSVFRADLSTDREGPLITTPFSDMLPNLMQILAEDNHHEQRIGLVQFFIEKYISLTMNSELKISKWYAEIRDHRVHGCAGLFTSNYTYFWRGVPGRQAHSPASILVTEYKEESDGFFCGIIKFLLDLEKSCTNRPNGDGTLNPCIEWHLMSMFIFFVDNRCWDLIDWAVKEYPIVLHAHSKLQGTILHILGDSNGVPASLIESVILQGVRLGIDRGGLLVRNESNEIPLELICKKKGREFMKLFPFLLKAQNPKLITVADLKEKWLFHKVCRGGQCAFALQLFKLCPEVVGIIDDKGRLPLHNALDPLSASNPSILRLLLRKGLKQGVGRGEGGLAGLLVKDFQGLTPLDLLLQRVPDARNSLVKVLLGGIVSNVPLVSSLLMQPMLYRPKPENSTNNRRRNNTDELHYWAVARRIYDVRLLSIIMAFKESRTTPDSNGRLPIHVAIEKGLGELGMELSLLRYSRWGNGNESGISEAAKAYLALRNVSYCLLCVDPITGLFPYQMVASKEELRTTDPETYSKRISFLSEIYTMLRLEPSVIFA